MTIFKIKAMLSAALIFSGFIQYSSASVSIEYTGTNGCHLLIDGPIELRDSTTIQKWFANDDGKCKLLDITLRNSPGGVVSFFNILNINTSTLKKNVVNNVVRYVRKVDVQGYCFSICASIAVGLETSYITKRTGYCNSIIGFHRASYAGLWGFGFYDAPEENERHRRALADNGTAKWFVEKEMNTDPEDISMDSLRSMVDNGLGFDECYDEWSIANWEEFLQSSELMGIDELKILKNIAKLINYSANVSCGVKYKNLYRINWLRPDIQEHTRLTIPVDVKNVERHNNAAACIQSRLRKYFVGWDLRKAKFSIESGSMKKKILWGDNFVLFLLAANGITEIGVQFYDSQDIWNPFSNDRDVGQVQIMNMPDSF